LVERQFGPDDVSTAGWGMDLAVGAKQTFVMMDP
jgi:hypothetical protein